jgi:hypothetical protein
MWKVNAFEQVVVEIVLMHLVNALEKNGDNRDRENI